MKSIIAVLGLFIISTGIMGQTQTKAPARQSKDEPQVPFNVLQAFKQNHPKHDYITWTVVGGNYKASSYDENRLHVITVYDPNATVLRTESELKSQDVPTAITMYYDNKTPAEKHYTVWMVQDKDGSKTYQSTSEGQTIIFNKDGQVITNAAEPAKN